VPSAETERIGEIARVAGVWLVIGVNERDGGTIYNTVLYFASDGTLANTHRKLMPTGSERTVAGPVREEQRIVTADLDLGRIRTQRRHFDPVGHYNRPDVFRLEVDTSPRPAVVEATLAH
jgi:Carbon-nitrogen hydrolase